MESVEHLWRNLRRIEIADTIDEPLTNEKELAVELIRRGEWRLDGDEEIVRGIMPDEFARLGVHPKVRVER